MFVGNFDCEKDGHSWTESKTVDEVFVECESDRDECRGYLLVIDFFTEDDTNGVAGTWFDDKDNWINWKWFIDDHGIYAIRNE